VIVDTTPAKAVADFQVVQQVCDGVIIVVRPDHTNRQAFLKTFEGGAQDKILGTVINAYEDWLFSKGHDNYSYYGESPAPKKGSRKG
jgi:Mrp family chromosome partitioning ATPase